MIHLQHVNFGKQLLMIQLLNLEAEKLISHPWFFSLFLFFIHSYPALSNSCLAPWLYSDIASSNRFIWWFLHQSRAVSIKLVATPFLRYLPYKRFIKWQLSVGHRFFSPFVSHNSKQPGPISISKVAHYSHCSYNLEICWFSLLGEIRFLKALGILWCKSFNSD